MTTAQTEQLKRAILALSRMREQLESHERRDREPLAIVGLGCRFPGGASNPDEFWKLLSEGRDAVGVVPPERWDAEAYYHPDPDAPGKMSTKWGAFLPHLDQFDPEFFGIAPREAVTMDPQQRLLLEVAWEALEHGGHAPKGLAGSSVGVFVGVNSNEYYQLAMQAEAAIDTYAISGGAASVAAGRLSYVLGLQGPSMVVDTACSSSLTAVHLAGQSLRAGECRMALAAGVYTVLTPALSIGLSKAHLMAADGRCKTFDAAADGFVQGEGCGVVVLKRLSDALADGDRILALVPGSAVNQDGRSSGLTAPSAAAQEAVIRQALAHAGLAPSLVSYIEAHGTGTTLGDPIEARGLAAVFGAGREHPLVLGSVKTNIGHTGPAAGIAGLIKVVLALQHREIPPHLHFTTLNPHMALDGLVLEIPTRRRPWEAIAGRRIAGVSSFGLSGTNVHVLVEEAPAPESKPAEWERPVHLLCLSAQNETALRDLASQYQACFAQSEAVLADVCYTAGVGRTHFNRRLAVLAADTAQVRTRLAAFLAGERVAGVVHGMSNARLPRLAFVFTGQGAQYAGMGHRLYQTQPRFRATLERCQAALREHLERPLLSVLFEDSDLLNNTAYAQPALFALEVALADLWRSWGIVPDTVLGHSVGEYAAACVAGVFGLEAGVRLVATRGRLMQALPGGAMAAVFAPCDRVQAVLDALGEGLVAVAAENGPANTVISGDREVVDRIIEYLKGEGIDANRLIVSHAFHSPLLEPMLDEFERVAAQESCAVPQIPVVSNVTGAVVQSFDAAYWRRQARQPVRFATGLQCLVEQGCEVFVEIGPHPVLSSLGASDVGTGAWIPSLRRGAEDWATLLEGLGRLYTLGLAVDWAGFDHDYPRHKVALPTYPFQRRRCWLDTVLPRPVTPVSAGVRPLLGRHLASPLPDIQFETGLNMAAFPYLLDHRVYDVVVVAGAVHIAMILALASETWGNGPCTIAALSFEEPLIVGEEEQCIIHIVLSPTGQCRIFSQAPDASWRLHVTSEVRREGTAPGRTVCQNEVMSRCVDEISGRQWTEALVQRGITIGPSFQGMQRLWRRDGEALASIHLPDAVNTAGYAFHPALLDACFQVVGGALQAGHDRTYLPVGIGRLTVHHPPSRTLWCHATLRPGGDPEACSADLCIVDEGGRCVAAIEDLQVKQVSREVVRGFVRRTSDTWFQRIDWQLQPLSPSIPAERRYLILADAGGLGARLAERLGSHCVLAFAGREFAPIGADSFCLDPASPPQWQRLLAALPEYQDIVHLWSFDTTPPSCTTPASLQRDQERICGSTLHLIQALPETQARRLWLVTRGAAFETAAPAAATLGGLGSVIAVEHPELHCVHIDLDSARDAETLDFLSREILAAGAEAQVVFRQEQRYVARLVPYVPRHGNPPRLRDTTLITGGLGGLGLQVARWAVERGGRHLVLVGRRPPSAPAMQVLSELEQAGARIHVVPADVSQATDIERVMALLQSLPPLRGVVHTAGLLADGVLLQQDWSRFSDVFAAKVTGAWLLHQSTQTLPLDFFVLFSSVAAFAGATGQGNYAAGNAFLDALARYRHTRGLPALSINWGRWAEVGMAVALDAANQQRLDALGLEPMPVEDCLVALDRALIQQQPQLGVAAIDWPRFVRQHLSGTAASFFTGMTGATAAPRASELLYQLHQAPGDTRQALLRAYLSGAIRGVLGLDAARPIDASTPLTSLGLDSLMAVELRNRINADLRLTLTLAPLLKGLDVEGLAALAGEQMTRQEQDWEVLTL